MIRILMLCSMAMTSASAQTGPAVAVFAGASYSHYVSPPIAAGFVTLAMRLGQSQVYSYNTIDLTAKTSTVRPGVAYLFAQSGPASLLAIADGGIALTSGVTQGSFSGGGAMVYRFGRSACYGMVTLRMAMQGGQAKPVFMAGLGRAF